MPNPNELERQEHDNEQGERIRTTQAQSPLQVHSEHASGSQAEGPRVLCPTLARLRATGHPVAER